MRVAQVALAVMVAFPLILSPACSSAPTRAGSAQAVQPSVETGPARHRGDTADDSAIWIHPEDPSASLIIGDDKGGGVLVWDLTGRELQFIDGSKHMNNLDLRYNFPLRGSYEDGTAHERVALVGVVNESDAALSFYKVNPRTRRLEPAGSVELGTSNPYGGCMYLSTTGRYYFFPNWKSGMVQQIELADGGSGKVTGRRVRQFDVGGQPEGCVADDILQHLYIGEEDVGIWKYGAEPDSGNGRKPVDQVGARLVADVEGMSIYYRKEGTGYLIVSSQGNSTFAVYEREGDNTFLKSFRVAANGSIDETSVTDGLDVTNYPLGSGFPSGVFVAHDAHNAGAPASNHKLVPFERIATTLGLTMDTEWDPRQVGQAQ